MVMLYSTHVCLRWLCWMVCLAPSGHGGCPSWVLECGDSGMSVVTADLQGGVVCMCSFVLLKQREPRMHEGSTQALSLQLHLSTGRGRECSCFDTCDQIPEEGMPLLSKQGCDRQL
jgi:hypothetical protein